MNALQLPHVLQLLTVILLAVVFYILPRWSKPGIFFAVTVATDDSRSEERERVLTGYRRRIIAWTIPAVVATMIGIASSNLWWSISGQMILTAGGLLSVLWARAQMQPYAVPASSVREASLVRPSEPLPGGLALWSGPFLLYAAFVVWLLSRWDSFPDRFPVHWNHEFEADRWADKSLSSILSGPTMGLALCICLVPMAWAILNRSRRVHREGPAAELERNRKRAIAEMVLVMNYFVILIFLLFGFSPLVQTPQASRNYVVLVYMLSVTGGLGVAIFGLVRYSKYFLTSKRASEEGEDGVPIGDRTPDECWKGGVVYVNRNDPAWIVENRIGMGFTFNFGHPAAWILTSLLVVGPLAVALLM